jgi:hypothetical protein
MNMTDFFIYCTARILLQKYISELLEKLKNSYFLTEIKFGTELIMDNYFAF